MDVKEQCDEKFELSYSGLFYYCDCEKGHEGNHGWWKEK